MWMRKGCIAALVYRIAIGAARHPLGEPAGVGALNNQCACRADCNILPVTRKTILSGVKTSPG